jgi:hypothetical protein
MPFVNTMFLKMARQFSRGDVISFDWLCSQVPSEKKGIQFGPDPDPDRIVPVGMVWYSFFYRVVPSVPNPTLFGPPGSGSFIRGTDTDPKTVIKPLISTIL